MNFPPHFLLDSPLSPKTRFLRRLLLATGVPRGGVRGFKPPLDLQNLFWIMCLQNILCNSALILIKSYIFYRKTLKIVHQFHILLQPLPGLCHWTPLGDFRPSGLLIRSHHVNPLHCKILRTPICFCVVCEQKHSSSSTNTARAHAAKV